MAISRLDVTGNVVALLLTLGSQVWAADYYFDSVAGDDSNDGSSESVAKKTLKVPAGSAHTLHIKRGSAWTMNLSLTNVTVTTYGTGERPAILGTITVSKSTVDGLAAKPPKGLTKAVNGINVMSDSTLRNCEVDGGGTAEYLINVGIGVMGQNNRIIGNYVHDLAWSASGGEMDNSGGAEGIMVMASNNEIAFNSAVRCASVNSTLGGFEGGCFEIVNGKALSTISNVSFHHNYCERSVGMWEGCSGDFSATGGGIQENHAIIENVTVSYNLSVDSMWLYLLQPVNTDFRNVVFANNTLIHTAKSKEYWDNSSFHYSMANAVATYTNNSSGVTYETDNQYYKKGAGFQPGTIIVKNNIFVDDVSATRYSMFLSNLTDHSNNIFVPANATVGNITLDSTEKKVNLSDLALTSDYRLTVASTPALDVGAVAGMSGNGTLAVSVLDTNFFSGVFTQDIDAHPVPCGAGVDIGASEYCSGAGGVNGTVLTIVNAAGGASGVGGGTGALATGNGGTNVTINVGGASTVRTSNDGTLASGVGGASRASSNGISTNLPDGGGSMRIEANGSSNSRLAAAGRGAAIGSQATGDEGGCTCRVSGTLGHQRNWSMVIFALIIFTNVRTRRQRCRVQENFSKSRFLVWVSAS
jgi:hypothetical protein